MDDFSPVKLLVLLLIANAILGLRVLLVIPQCLRLNAEGQYLRHQANVLNAEIAKEKLRLGMPAEPVAKEQPLTS